MAKNKVQAGDVLYMKNDEASADKSSGDAFAQGNITGVCLEDIADDASGQIDTKGVYDFICEGKDGSGDKAIVIGDPIYYDAGTLNADDSNGTLFGYALEAVVSASTTTKINVKLK